MYKIKFANSQDLIDGIVFVESENIVRLENVGDVNLSGFKVFVENGYLLGDYSNYNTLYKEEDNGYMLSNDNSVYEEPKPQPPYVPTLEEIRSRKLSEMSAKCQQTIYNGVDVILPSGTEHFSLTVQDQLNLLKRKDQLQESVKQVEYHADGQLSRYYTAEEMKKIIETTDNFILYQTSYCNSLMNWIKTLEDKEKLEKIQYGDVVPKQEQSEPFQMLMKL